MNTDMKDRELKYWTTPPHFLLVIVDLDSSNILGTVSMQKKSEDTAELNRLSVRPDVRGRGIGRKLLEAFIAEVTKSGFKWIYLDTTDPQKDAVKLYEKMGFKKTEECGIIHHGIGLTIPNCFHGVSVNKYLYKIVE